MDWKWPEKTNIEVAITINWITPKFQSSEEFFRNGTTRRNGTEIIESRGKLMDGLLWGSSFTKRKT